MQATTPTARFADEEHAQLVLKTRRMLRYCIVLVAAFGALDALFLPHLLRSLWVIRAVLVLLAAGSLLALRRPAVQAHAGALGVAVAVATGLGIVGMTGLDTGGSSPYYAGISFVMLCSAVMLPWRWQTSLGFVAVLFAAYVGLSAWKGVGQPRLFAAHVAFLGGTALITVISHRTHEAVRRRDFAQRMALEAVSHHREVFFANVTHELKTPLAAMLGFVEMLEEECPPGSVRHGVLERLRANATTMYRLVADLLDVARIDAGRLRLVEDRVDVVPIVERVAANVRAIARDPGAVVLRAEAAVAAVVGDPARVEQIVTNLAANALRFGGSAPMTFSIRTAVLRAADWDRVVPGEGVGLAAEAFVEIAVTDRGPGIHPDALSRLFMPFEQAHAPDGAGGTGLGLALSAGLAAAMRAYITVRSAPGAGAVFALQLPALVDGGGAVAGRARRARAA